MVVIDHIDGVNRKIYLHADTVGTDFKPIDAYKEMRELRRTDESLRKYDLFLSAHGNEPKGGGKYTERYVKQLLGTTFVVYDSTYTLNVIGTIITDDGQEGVDCFDRSELTSPNVVDISYTPPQVEIIEIATGGALTTEEHDKLFAVALDVWKVTKAAAELEADSIGKHVGKKVATKNDVVSNS